MPPRGRGAVIRRRRDMCKVALAVAAVVAIATSGALALDPNPKEMEKAFAAVAERAIGSSVAIRTYEVISEGPPRIAKALGHGSGVVVSADGAVLTNQHVVSGATWVVVILPDGTFLDAKVVGSDERGDLAILRVNAGRPLRPMAIAKPGGLAPGKWAFAVGNPKGIAKTSGQLSFTVGTVSGIGRDMTGKLKDRPGLYGNMVECDLSIWPGSSGGPLVNSDGELCGVVTAMECPGKGLPSVTAYAIPLEGHALRSIRSMLAGEPVRYGFVGVETADLDPAVRASLEIPPDVRGALVARVMEGLPAEAAGVLAGDVVTSFRGRAVPSAAALSELVGESGAGEVAEMIVWRDGRAIELTAVVGSR